MADVLFHCREARHAYPMAPECSGTEMMATQAHLYACTKYLLPTGGDSIVMQWMKVNGICTAEHTPGYTRQHVSRSVTSPGVQTSTIKAMSVVYS